MVIAFEDNSSLECFEEILINWGGELYPQSPRVFDLNQLTFTESDFQPARDWGSFDKKSSNILRDKFFLELSKEHLSILNALERQDSDAVSTFENLRLALKGLCEETSMALKVILYKDDDLFRSVEVSSVDELNFLLADEFSGKGDESDAPIYYFKR